MGRHFDKIGQTKVHFKSSGDWSVIFSLLRLLPDVFCFNNVNINLQQIDS